jgi:hypothetical protein
MSTEQQQNQLEKWRRQERFNRFLVRFVSGFLICLAVVGVTFLLVNLLKGTPTFTPATLINEWKAREGQTVRLRGEVTLIAGVQVRIGEGSVSVSCTLLRTPDGLKEHSIVTVEGRVSASEGLVNCKLVND